MKLLSSAATEPHIPLRSCWRPKTEIKLANEANVLWFIEEFWSLMQLQKSQNNGSKDENSHYCHSAIEPGTEPPASPLRCDSVCLYESAADCLSVPSSAQTNRSFARISVCHRSVLEKLFLFVRNPTRRRSSRPVCCCSSEVCVWEQWIFSSLFLENKKRGNAPNIRQGRSQTSLEHDSFVTATM